MSNKDDSRPLVFSVVEDDGENVTIEISEENYRRDLEAGLSEEETLKPGRYKLRRGGFLNRLVLLHFGQCAGLVADSSG